MLPTLTVLGVPIHRLDRAEALAEVDRLLATPGIHAVHYANAHSLNVAYEHPVYRGALRAAALVLNDGAGLGLAGRLLGQPFPANLNGSDFTPALLERAAAAGAPVGFLGGAPGVAAAAAERLAERIHGLDVRAVIDGYSGRSGDELAEELRVAGVRVLLVALGNPAQELWLARHGEGTGAQLVSGVGAFFDFTAGRVPRAPAWMNRLGIEWLYRLRQEPRRMWRRYIVGNPRFLLRVAREIPRHQRT